MAKDRPLRFDQVHGSSEFELHTHGMIPTGADPTGPPTKEDSIQWTPLIITPLHKKLKEKLGPLKFKAFITDFTDDYNSEWASESVFGRMDPLDTFQATSRKISLAWDLVAYDLTEAQYNLGNINKVAQLLYPTYKRIGGRGSSAASITTPPLVRIEFGGLIYDALSMEGLVGHINSLSINPDFDAGAFVLNLERTTATARGTEVKGSRAPHDQIFPKVIRVNCDFSPIHTHELGWSTNGDPLWGEEAAGEFPYSAGSDFIQYRNGKAVTVKDPNAEQRKRQALAAAKTIYGRNHSITQQQRAGLISSVGDQRNTSQAELLQESVRHMELELRREEQLLAEAARTQRELAQED